MADTKKHSILAGDRNVNLKTTTPPVITTQIHEPASFCQVKFYSGTRLNQVCNTQSTIDYAFTSDNIASNRKWNVI